MRRDWRLLGTTAVFAWVAMLGAVSPADAQEDAPEASPEGVPEASPIAVPEEAASPEAVSPADADPLADPDTDELADPVVEGDDVADGVNGEDEDPYRVKAVEITYTPEDVFKEGGSVQVLDAELLEKFGYNDPNQALLLVPGVYIRQEDGFGLRPNIGLRGASSERSSKVTLMEDGILFGPAPYSAPAAYYFPMMGRITQVEVLKGPAAILAGPQTIGGAINLHTRRIPEAPGGGVELGYGSFDTVLLHGHAGGASSWGGLLAEGIHIGNEGFKELDGGGDTGFQKDELMVKGRLNTDPSGALYHELNLKLGYSREGSNETYLGLSDADFAAAPYRRYRASALDRMELERYGVSLSYALLGDDLEAELTLYRHDLTRDWRKVDGFAAGPSLLDILTAPDTGSRQVFYDVLTGAEDSGSPGEILRLGTNSRTFLSTGADSRLRAGFETGPVEHELALGLRYHFDSVDRHHFDEPHAMIGGTLSATGEPAITTARNVGSSSAVASYAAWALGWEGLTARPGVRAELIQSEHDDEQTGTLTTNDQFAVLLGMGLHYELLANVGVLAGVHQGFSPVTPGQSPGVEPEKSINYEAGVRYLDTQTGTTAELVGFYNDYSNLVAQCTLSSGCPPDALDQQFNAGAVDVFGAELLVGHTLDLGPVDLSGRAAYTFTLATFGEDFASGNPVYGDVEAGGEVPYIPAHQASVGVGLGKEIWGLELSGTYLAAVLEGGGADGALSGIRTDDAVVLDASARLRPAPWVELFVRGENLLSVEAVASRRPFGARPIKPIQAHGAVRFFF